MCRRPNQPNQDHRQRCATGLGLGPDLVQYIYISDLPHTESHKFGYADDLAIATQARTYEALEEKLSRDIDHIHSYFDVWYLRMSQSKTCSKVFHLDNNTAGRNLQILDSKSGTYLPPETFPKYLGVYLDRSLTYKKNTDNTVQKLKKKSIPSEKTGGDVVGG